MALGHRQDGWGSPVRAMDSRSAEGEPHCSVAHSRNDVDGGWRRLAAVMCTGLDLSNDLLDRQRAPHRFGHGTTLTHNARVRHRILNHGRAWLTWKVLS